MADPIFSAPTAAPDAAGGLPQAPKPLSSYAPKSLADYEPRRESSTALPLSAYEPGAERGKYTPKFRYAHRMQTDADFDGSLTAKRGAEEGRPDITADTVEELNLFGEVVPAETLRGVDGGERLIRIAGLNRKGRRGFLDALLKEGPAFDFVPFVGDLASAGIAVRDMVKVRDIFKKGTEQGFQNLSLEEKVLAKLYMEEGERSAKQTLGATVGSIVRQAPAFAVEMFAYGYGFKRLASAIGVGGAKRAFYKAVANEAVGALREKGVSKVTAALGKKSMAQYVTPLVDDALSRAAMPAVSAAERAALIKSTAKSAQAALTLMSNPSRVKSFTNWAAEYATRGFVNHFDDVVRAMPPTVRGKLADAAGVAFVEAPVKGLMYGTFDAAVVNPIGARLMGAGEAVTETELGLGVSGVLRNADKGLSGEALAEANEETLRNAKFLAWGATVAEYASEVSGRAFTNLGGILTENIGGDLGRRAASRGLRAVAGRVAKADADIGSQVSKTIDRYLGKEATLGATLRELREGVARAAAKGGELAKDIPGVAGKSAQDILADGRLMDQVMKKYFAFKDKSFIGYWLANKAAGRGVTPQAIQRTLEKMSYDDILGEFMEERYNGFAQGLFGLDGEEHEGMMQRLAHAAKEAVPTFQQGAAEIIAFALPVYGRAMANRAYYALGNSSLGKWEKAVSGLAELTSEGPAVVFEGSDGVRRFGVASTGKSGDKLEDLKLRLGTVGASASNDNFRATTEEIANDIANAIPDLLRVQHGK
ncbi:MAG: hypothetical protein WC277_11830, partial [Bacilli bacterium]